MLNPKIQRKIVKYKNDTVSQFTKLDFVRGDGVVRINVFGCERRGIFVDLCEVNK